KGPRSFTRTFTTLPVFRFVTRTTVPKGKVRWAAVKAVESKGCPLAARRPWLRPPYQEARPSPAKLRGSGTTGRGVEVGPMPGCVVAAGRAPGRAAEEDRATGKLRTWAVPSFPARAAEQTEPRAPRKKTASSAARPRLEKRTSCRRAIAAAS